MKTVELLLAGGLLFALSAWRRASPPSSPASSLREFLGEKLAAGGSAVVVPPGQELESIARLYNREGQNDLAVLIRDLPHQYRSVQRVIARRGESAYEDPWVRDVLSLYEQYGGI